MSDKKISELVAVTTVEDTDEYVVARAGASNKISGANLKAAGVGGSSAFVGAVLTLSASVTDYVSGTVIPFDTAAYDSNGFFDAGGTKIVVPAGKAGWYRVGLAVQASFDPDTQSEFACKINTSGNPDDAIGVFTVVTTGSGIATLSYVLGPLAVGDDLRARVTWATGGGTVQLNYPAAQLTCQHLGPAT